MIKINILDTKMSAAKKKKDEEKSEFFKISQPGLAARLPKKTNIIGTGLIQHELQEQEVGLREGSGVGAEQMPNPGPTTGRGSLFGEQLPSTPLRSLPSIGSSLSSSGFGPIQGPDDQSFMRDLPPFLGDFDSPLVSEHGFIPAIFNDPDILRTVGQFERQRLPPSPASEVKEPPSFAEAAEQPPTFESIVPQDPLEPLSPSGSGVFKFPEIRIAPILPGLFRIPTTTPLTSPVSSTASIPSVLSTILRRPGNNRDILDNIITRRDSSAPLLSPRRVSIPSDLPDLVQEGKHDTASERPNDLREEKFQERTEMEGDIDDAREEIKQEFKESSAPLSDITDVTQLDPVGAGTLAAVEAAAQIIANRRASGIGLSPEEFELFNVDEDDIDGDGGLSAAEIALSQNGDAIQARVAQSSALLRRLDNEPALAEALTDALEKFNNNFSEVLENDPRLAAALGKFDPEFKRLLITKKPVRLDAGSQLNLIQQGFAHYLDDVNLFNVAFV